MNQTRGLPPYPPANNAWQYPPPPISRRWFWVAILVSVVSVVAVVSLTVVGAEIASKDFPSLIQNDELITVIGQECRVMTETIESMPVQGNPRRQVAILADQNQAVEQMLEAVRMVDGDVRAADKPTDEWLADWDTLILARKHYAAQLRRGRQPSLRIPRDANGDYTYLRMNDVLLTQSNCTVPSALLSPYPEDLDNV